MPAQHTTDNVTNWSTFGQPAQQPLQQSIEQPMQQPMQAAVGSSYAVSPATEASSAPEKDEDLVYPFGGWTDENNYRK
jgi:hypothetical protein